MRHLSYIKKVEALSKNKNIFTEDYHIESLDEKKRKELLNSISNSLGFIIEYFRY